MSVEIIAADWPATGVVAGTTTRVGGVSRGRYEALNLAAHVGDDDAAVSENRRRFATSCRLPAEPLWLRQVHGTDVASVPALTARGAAPTADAIVSPDGSGVLAILTADCLPVVLCEPEGSALAALHCGWRSLSGGIVAETLGTIGRDPGTLMAWLGPAISQRAFEVGDEVRDIFLAGVEGAARCFAENDNDRWQADLYGLARLYLEAAGVERLFGGGLCTFSDVSRFYSYRRDGETGRMATFVYRPRRSR